MWRGGSIEALTKATSMPMLGQANWPFSADPVFDRRALFGHGR
jgi:hypothetical protein